MIAMIAAPAVPTLLTVRRSAFIDLSHQHASPYGYTVSLLLFVVPVLVIGLWFIPQEGIKVSQISFWITIAILFPLGSSLDFFFGRYFLRFPDPDSTIGIPAPALGGNVPLEEYVFYLTGFLTVLLMYIWLDEYWLFAYSVPNDAEERTKFDRLLRFHPQSLVTAVLLIVIAIACRSIKSPHAPGFPGYFTFLVLTALAPSAVLFPTARQVINWRAFSLTTFFVLLISIIWEATLALPYGWWNYQPEQMIGLRVLAWDDLPIEAIVVWIAVTYITVTVYETVKRWKASGKPATHAFFGPGKADPVKES
jgi:hypothetical protein